VNKLPKKKFCNRVLKLKESCKLPLTQAHSESPISFLVNIRGNNWVNLLDEVSKNTKIPKTEFCYLIVNRRKKDNKAGKEIHIVENLKRAGRLNFKNGV